MAVSAGLQMAWGAGLGHGPEAQCIAEGANLGQDDYGSERIMPPSTPTTWPVTYEAAGESRNAATRPTSAGSP